MKAFLGAFCAVLIAAGAFYFLTSKQRTEESAKATGIAIAQELEHSALQRELAVAIPIAESELKEAEELLADWEASKPSLDKEDMLKILAPKAKVAKERLERLKSKMATLASR